MKVIAKISTCHDLCFDVIKFLGFNTIQKESDFAAVVDTSISVLSQVQ